MIHNNEDLTATPRLAIRVQAENRLHHLWDNNGTWWIHYTIHPDAYTKQRIRRSLGTRDLAIALVRRDTILAGHATLLRQAA